MEMGAKLAVSSEEPTSRSASTLDDKRHLQASLFGLISSKAWLVLFSCVLAAHR